MHHVVPRSARWWRQHRQRPSTAGLGGFAQGVAASGACGLTKSARWGAGEFGIGQLDPPRTDSRSDRRRHQRCRRDRDPVSERRGHRDAAHPRAGHLFDRPQFIVDGGRSAAVASPRRADRHRRPATATHYIGECDDCAATGVCPSGHDRLRVRRHGAAGVAAPDPADGRNNSGVLCAACRCVCTRDWTLDDAAMSCAFAAARHDGRIATRRRRRPAAGRCGASGETRSSTWARTIGTSRATPSGRLAGTELAGTELTVTERPVSSTPDPDATTIRGVPTSTQTTTSAHRRRRRCQPGVHAVPPATDRVRGLAVGRRCR